MHVTGSGSVHHTPHCIISTHLYISMAASSSSPNSSSFSSSSSSVMSSYVLTVQRKQQSRQVITRSANNLTFRDHLNGVKLQNTEHFQKYQTLYLISFPEFSWIHLQNQTCILGDTLRNTDIYPKQSILPTDCCWRANSSSSSSLGSSLGGRMPFFLRISFHSVSAFGSWAENKAQIQVVSFRFILALACDAFWLFSKLNSVSLKRIINLQSLIYAQTKHISFTKLGMSYSLRHCGLGCVLFLFKHQIY